MRSGSAQHEAKMVTPTYTVMLLLEINRALGITDNIPESSFGTVNSKLAAAGKRDNDLRAVAREVSWPQVLNPGWMPKSKRAAVHLQYVQAVARQTVGKRHGHRSPIPAGYRNRNVQPSICNMCKQSLAKLLGSVMATGPQSRLDTEIETCRSGW